MHRIHTAPAVSRFFVLGVAILLFSAGCGGGGGGQSGDTHGTDTPPSISHIDQILGIQGTLYADPNGYVTVNYHLQDDQYDAADVEIQYAVDTNGSNQLEEDEYFPATSAPGGEGTVALNGSPGGAAHSFKWDSLADIDTGRYVTEDYEYTAAGRRARDGFGDIIYRSYPGVKFRIRPVQPNNDGVWRYTDAFSISNNHAPAVTSLLESDVIIPPEGADDDTVNEIVHLRWKVRDEDGDPVTVAVDWLVVPTTFDPSALSQEEIEALPWQWATSAPLAPPLSEGTANLPAGDTAVEHHYGWDSVEDVGTENTGIWLRMRPIDGKNEVGAWAYMDAPFHLNNFAIVTSLAPLGDTRLDVVATLLTSGNVLLTGGRSTASDSADDAATIFYPTSQTQTLSGSTAPITDGMLFPRAGHTATRLFRAEDPNDGTKLLDARVLIVGGRDDNGDPQATAEIYDPSTPAGVSPFSQVASMGTLRSGHFAILLASGKVLVGGGVDENGTVLKSAEIYDPMNDRWDPVATDMGEARTEAQAVILPGLQGSGTVAGSQDEYGFVLVAGGSDGAASLGSIEVFDVLAGEFQNMDSGSDMTSDRTRFTLSPTIDGVWAAVAAGGEASPPTDSIERYNQETETWTEANVTMGTERAGHVALLQGDGTILLAGGVADAQGTLAGTVEIYDPDRDTIRIANGELREPVADAAAVVLGNGRSVIFGGVAEGGSADTIQAFTPDTETGFNAPPTVQVRTPLAIEPWAFGVRIYFRAQDTEGDDVRIVAQFKVKEGADPLTDPDATNDPAIWTQVMKDQYLNRWLPAAMQVQTVLGDQSSGSSGLAARTETVSQADNPIDNPDDPDTPSDLGEHLFVWKTNGGIDPVVSLEAGGIPKGDYNNVYFRIIVYGATEGGVATTGSFGMTKNAPVIARIDPPIADPANGDKVYGNVVFPFYLQDSDPGEYAFTVWEFGKDLNGDGKIVEGEFVPGVGTETWSPMTPADTSVTVNLPGGPYTNPADFIDIPTAATGNEQNGIPRGVKKHFIWNAVNDIGAPVTPRTDIFVRCTPYDYGTLGTSDVDDMSPGIGSERSGWTLDSDPNGLYLDSWNPKFQTTPDPGVFEYTGVGTNEPLVFQFSKAVTNVSDTTITIAEQGSSVPIQGVFVTNGAIVTWYPQVDELPHPTGILEATTDYQITMYGWDPVYSGRQIIHAAGANTADTNAYNLLHDGSSANAFQTGAGAYLELDKPSYAAPLQTPATTTNVSTTLTKIEMKFDEFLDPATVTHDNFEVYIQQFGSLKSVVPGTITLENRTSPTGVQTGVLIYTFAGSVGLPKGATVQVEAKTGIRDLYGNPLSATAAPSFDMEGTGGTVSTSLTETFLNTTYRDYDETTVWWGDNDPKVAGDFAGHGTSGAVTGLFDFGNGGNGSFSGGGTWTSTSTDNLRQYSSFSVPYGYTLTLRGTHPWTIRCTGAATIGGTINASGSTGATCVSRYGTSSGSLAAGGAGGCGGGQGSSAGSWTANSKTPITYNDAKNYLGVTSGTGTGGSGVGIYNTGTYYPRYMAGGGGAGHAAAGKTGYHGYGNAAGYYPNGGYLGIKGGDGGKGGVHLTAPTDPAGTMPTVALNAAGVKLGTGGTLHVAPFAVSDTAVSTFYDAETVIPTYTSGAWTGTALTDLWVEGAMADPATGAVDPDSGTGWVKLIGSGGSGSYITQRNGYRFVRFKLTIGAGASVTSVIIHWAHP